MIEWLPKENKLDNQQMSIIRKILTSNGNHFITGYPGTGKSVVLAWAALKASGVNSILTYTNALVECIRAGIQDADFFKKPKVGTIDAFVENETGGQDVLFIDEAQDLRTKTYQRGVEILPVLANRSQKVVFAADSEQSIYDNTISLDEIKQSFNVSSENVHHLDINYRMTKEMLDVVKVFFPRRTIKIESGRLNTDVKISKGLARSKEEGYEWIFEKSKTLSRPGRPSVVLFKKRAQIVAFINVVVPQIIDEIELNDALNARLRQLNVPIRFLGNGVGSLSDADEQGMLYVMTCHSAKGLDFETVFVPDCEEFNRGGNLFYVALTRARRNLFLLGDKTAQIHAKLVSCDFVRQVDVDVEALKKEEEDEDLF